MPEPDREEGRPQRAHKFPVHLGNVIATSYTPNADVPMAEEALFEERLEPPQVIQVPRALAPPDMWQLDLNEFHVHKHFAEQQDLTHLSIAPAVPRPPISHPFKNNSYFEMLKHMTISPSSHTNDGAKAIVDSIAEGRILPDEVQDFDPVRERKHLDNYGATSLLAGGPWNEGSVKVKMPCPRANNPPYTSEKDAPEYEVDGIRYRSLVDLIISRLTDPATSGSFTGTPFTEWWCPPGCTKPIRIYGEAHSSDIAIKLYDEIKGIPAPPEHPDIQSVVVLLMLGSDATHLASFGTASIWPLYVFFGNDSKYDTAKPLVSPAYHLAFFPKVWLEALCFQRSSDNFDQVPDNFADAYKKEFGIAPMADVMTHCKRELIHAVIELILQGRFAEAYTEGIIIEFPDGIKRRVFPRFFSYSADYPEKSVIALCLGPGNNMNSD